MKKLFLFLSLILVASKIGATGFITIDDLKYFIDTDNNEATLVANDYAEKEYIIPEEINYNGEKYYITALGNSCFANCKELTNINVPKNVKSLGKECFSGCNNLETIALPNTIEEIGAYCFYACSKLSTIEIPETITELKESCFEFCRSLSNINIPNSIKNIGDDCFQGCTNLEKVKFSKALSKLSRGCFAGCGFKEIDIPNNINSLEAQCFCNCSKLTKITLPEGLTIIGPYCFEKCNSLKEITIPSTVCSIAGGGFSCCNFSTIKCFAKNPPSSYGDDVFLYSDISTTLLYVPKESVEKYKNAKCWSNFSIILPIDSDNDNHTEKCRIPSISYISGKIHLSSRTTNAEYHYSITDSDIKTDAYSETGEIPLEATYKISAYATAAGYKASDKATATLYWINANLETTGIKQAKTRGVIASCHDGFISISGLDNNESVSFYTVDGKALGTQKAINGTASYAIGSNAQIVIARIGENSIKIINN